MAITVFITGATGNIGAKIVTRILKDNPFAQIILLLREDLNVAAQQRFEEVLRIVSPELDPAQTRTHDLRISELADRVLRLEDGVLLQTTASTKIP